MSKFWSRLFLKIHECGSYSSLTWFSAAVQWGLIPTFLVKSTVLLNIKCTHVLFVAVSLWSCLCAHSLAVACSSTWPMPTSRTTLCCRCWVGTCSSPVTWAKAPPLPPYPSLLMTAFGTQWVMAVVASYDFIPALMTCTLWHGSLVKALQINIATIYTDIAIFYGAFVL